LYNISAVPSWEKINQGMFKMYEGEILKKFPVVQHFLFGSMFRICECDPNTTSLKEDEFVDDESETQKPAHLETITE
jgi:serine/threonine-protein phosphatase 2A activator